jgi:hypothetical protein
VADVAAALQARLDHGGEEEASAASSPTPAAGGALTGGALNFGDVYAEKPEPEPPGWRATALAWLAVAFDAAENLTALEPETLTENERVGLGKILAGSVGLRLLGLLGVACVGVALGLTISAWVGSETQAVMWVPLILIPQILLGGFVVTVPQMNEAVRGLSHLMPSFCAQRVLDVSHIYGRATPRLTNRTQMPLFLTPDAEREMVEWLEGGETARENYYKVSPVNTSWQNLTVLPERLGEHRHGFRKVRGAIVYEDTTTQRNDVMLATGEPFLTARPALAGLLVLLGWMVVCYGATLTGLVIKQRGQ